MTTKTPEHAPAPRSEDSSTTGSDPRTDSRRCAPGRAHAAGVGPVPFGLRLGCAFIALLAFITLPALATTAPPAMNAGGSASAGSVSSASPAGVGCAGCNDGDACTEDTCDAEYQCIHTPLSCDDGLRCTDDICDPTTGCVHTPMDCSTGTVCVRAVCSEATGACEIVSKLTCSDHNACTTDSCDPETGCFHAPILCNDHDACTHDACDPQVGCIHRTGACGHGPGTAAPPGTGTDAPTITPSTGDDTAAGSAPLPDDRYGARSHAVHEGVRRALGEGEICALAGVLAGAARAGDPGAGGFMVLRLAGWPASGPADPAVMASWALELAAGSALAEGACRPMVSPRHGE